MAGLRRLSWKPGAGVLLLGSVHSDFTKLNGGAGSDARLAEVRRLADGIRDYDERGYEVRPPNLASAYASPWPGQMR